VETGPPVAPKACGGAPATDSRTQTASRPPAPADFDPERVAFDEGGADGLWAAGGAYKLHLAAKGVTYVPYLGADASRSWPLTFRLARVTSSGKDLPVDPRAQLERVRDTVSLVHGSVTERWQLRAAATEQSFVFARLPDRGELVVEVGFETELEVHGRGAGFRFAGPDGGVDYGAAIAIDASGNRIALESSLVDDRIVHRVPAAFVATATLPLVIDPIVSTFESQTSSYDFGSPDLAFEAGSGHFMLVYERRYSQTDTDVWCELRDQQGGAVAGSGAWIDVSTADWRKPQVAGNRAAQRFLVVAEARATGAQVTEVRARIRHAIPPFTLLPAITVSTMSNAAVDPDVGGDGNPVGPDHWAVVWEHRHSGTDGDVHYRMVRDDGTFTTGSSLVLENSSAEERRPRISKSNGSSDAATQSWMVVFTRSVGTGLLSTYGATLSWNGTITRPTFAAGPSFGAPFTEPDVSSPTELIGGRRHHLVVSRVHLNNVDHDVWADLYADGQMEASLNLTSDSLVYDTNPAVDCDGYRFCVAYQRATDVIGNNHDVMATTVHARYLPIAQLGFTEMPILLAGQPHWEGAPAVAARADSGDGRYMIAFEDGNGVSQPSNVRGAIYEGLRPGGLGLLPHGCHAFPITVIGEPMIGRRISFQVPGPISGPSTSGTLFGLPRNPPILLPQCAMPCYLGVDGNAYPPLIHIDIPIDGSLVGAQAAVQGWDLVGGSCFGAALRLSDTYLITVR
jgi:hypothetical protein